MEKYSVTEQQLFDLIDGKCSIAESRKIKDAIDSSTELNAKYQRLLYMHQAMSNHNLVKTPNDFLDNVMNSLESRKFIIDGLFDSINKLGLKLLAFMLILMAITIYFVNNESIALNFDGLIKNTMLVENYNLNVNTVNTLLNDKLILNGLLFTGLLVTLLLFDKVVLKPWFTRRNSTLLS